MRPRQSTYGFDGNVRPIYLMYLPYERAGTSQQIIRFTFSKSTTSLEDEPSDCTAGGGGNIILNLMPYEPAWSVTAGVFNNGRSQGVQAIARGRISIFCISGNHLDRTWVGPWSTEIPVSKHNDMSQYSHILLGMCLPQPCTTNFVRYEGPCGRSEDRYPKRNECPSCKVFISP